MATFNSLASIVPNKKNKLKDDTNARLCPYQNHLYQIVQMLPLSPASFVVLSHDGGL